jgi:hypothetical protein
MFFKSHTKEDCKILFKKLALKLHPDCGGDHQLMLLLNEAYEDRMNWLTEIEKSIKEAETAKKTKSYENVVEKIYNGDERILLLQEVDDYMTNNPSLKLDFVVSVLAFYFEKGYVTSGQYNAILKIYHQYEMYDKTKAPEKSA